MVSSDTPIVQPDPETPPETPVDSEGNPQPQPEQPASAPILTANVVSDGSAEAFVHVQPGDSWESIAEAANTTVEALHALNAALPYFSERSVQVGGYVRIA